MRSCLAAVAVAVCSLAVSSPAQRVSADGAGQTLDYLANQYFEQVLYKYNPSEATQLGLHQYDMQLEDYSAANVGRETAALHDWQRKILCSSR